MKRDRRIPLRRSRRVASDVNAGRLVLAFVAVLALAAGALAFAVSPSSAGSPLFDGSDVVSVNQLSDQQLIDGIDQAGVSTDRGMLMIQKLWQQRKSIPRQDLVSVLMDKSRSQESRALMVDLLAGTPEEARLTDDMRGFLGDGRLGSTLTARIIVSYPFLKRDTPLLSALASGTDDQVAFQALKKLGTSDSSAARQIALTTISHAEDSSDLKLSAAYKVLVRSGKLETDQATKKALLRHLATVLADADTSPELRDSAMFALADMRSLDALRMLLESDNVDRPVAVGAVNENALVIKTALDKNPDEATIELAVTAMEICPLRDLAEPLGAARGRVSSAALVQRLNSVLVNIARNGESINRKWTQD